MPDGKKEKDHKKAQVLVLDTLNDLFTEAADDKTEKRSVSVAAVIIYSDGSVSQQMAGDLDRILLTGALTDLVNQIFFECKQRELNDVIEKSVEQLYLANVQSNDGKKPN